jgi:hypothetical protein
MSLLKVSGQTCAMLPVEAERRSRTATNLIFSSARFGVRPAGYSAAKSSTTSWWNRSIETRPGQGTFVVERFEPFVTTLVKYLEETL